LHSFCSQSAKPIADRDRGAYDGPQRWDNEMGAQMAVRLANPGKDLVATDETLVLMAIEDARATWRTAELISRDTGIPLDRVQRALEATSADIVVAPEADAQGHTLYSTRHHYRKTTSFLRRYIDTLESS